MVTAPTSNLSNLQRTTKGKKLCYIKVKGLKGQEEMGAAGPQFSQSDLCERCLWKVKADF